MITGEYKFFENGKEIASSKNIITAYGKRFVTLLLAGINTSSTKDIAIGIAGSSDYAVADINTRLGFEFYRTPVILSSIDTTSSYVAVYKGIIPTDVAGIISEVGLYPGTRTSINNYDSKFLSDFEDSLIWYTSINTHPDEISSGTPAARIGSKVLEFKFETADTSNTTREYKYNVGQLDLSGYSAKDSLSLAYNRQTTNLASLKVKFYSSSGNYYYGTFTPSSGTGNKITQISMADVFSNISGTPVSSSISTIGIELTRTSAASQAIAYMDGLRINDEDTFDPNFGLISRSALATPITKTLGRAIDIEYKLTLDF